MEAARALADLTEISAQIESAVIAREDGSPIASTLGDDERAGAVAEAAVELVRAAEEAQRAGDEGPIQIQAATPEGCVFVVRDGSHLVVAVTGREPTVGLVFYDLKTCLRLVGENGDEEPKPARRPKQKEAAADGET
jgi:predicted regulator of Ras-like GTPase activity (Roadblock/LC7/MglB family)